MAKITAIVNDLMFMTKIRNTAEYFGLSVAFVGNESQVDHYLKDCELILIDLENDFVDSLGLIERLKSNPGTSSIKLIGYMSHLNTPLRAKAMASGCDSVLSRFEFNANVREILQAACC
jgi:CheY-like chemotaxis protein